MGIIVIVQYVILATLNFRLIRAASYRKSFFSASMATMAAFYTSALTSGLKESLRNLQYSFWCYTYTNKYWYLSAYTQAIRQIRI